MTTSKQPAIIIGGGIGGLASAILLARTGHKVTLLEKNDQLGGRAGLFEAEGFRFDMGPSWYLMPEVFENFFQLIGEDVHEHLELIHLSPSYRVFFEGRSQPVDIWSDLARDRQTFERFEPGAGDKLERYLNHAEKLYNIALNRFIYRNYSSPTNFLTPEMLVHASRMKVLTKMDNYVRGYFKSIELQQIMQYTLIFLGGSPYNTPALYNIMSHIDFNQGVYYPKGGMYKLIEVLAKIGRRAGVKYLTNSAAKHITTSQGRVTGVRLESGEVFKSDLVISNADLRYTETKLLDPADRSYSDRYWSKRTLAPSALLIYLGVKGKLPQLEHHNLYFAHDWKENFKTIFDSPAWPDNPSLYICKSSHTDPTVAPAEDENLFVLVPIAPGLTYTDEFLEDYATRMLSLLEAKCEIPDLKSRLSYKRLFCVRDFEDRYNSFGGSALGLAHTLAQTAAFRPNNASKKVKGLYYVGAGTNPGIGMPICLISAELAFKRIVGDRTIGPLRKLP